MSTVLKQPMSPDGAEPQHVCQMCGKASSASLFEVSESRTICEECYRVSGGHGTRPGMDTAASVVSGGPKNKTQ